MPSGSTLLIAIQSEQRKMHDAVDDLGDEFDIPNTGL